MLFVIGGSVAFGVLASVFTIVTPWLTERARRRSRDQWRAYDRDRDHE